MTCCLLFYLFISYAISFDQIPLDVHERTWSFLDRRERCKMREVSPMWDEHYQSVYAEECKKVRAFYTFSLFISKLSVSQPYHLQLDDFKAKMYELDLYNHFDGSKGDTVFIERLVLDLALNMKYDESSKHIVNVYRADRVKHLCIALLNSFDNVVYGQGLNLMLRAIHATERYGESWRSAEHITLLNELFAMGKRLRNFALLHLDLYLAANVGCEHETCRLRSIWQTIEDVALIGDYLERKELRCEDGSIGTVCKPIKLIIEDAIQENGTLRTDKLHYFVDYPHLFLHLSRVLEYAFTSEHVNQEIISKLVCFFMVNKLTTWGEIEQTYYYIRFAFGPLGCSLCHIRFNPLGDVIGNPLSTSAERRDSTKCDQDKDEGGSKCCCSVM